MGEMQSIRCGNCGRFLGIAEVQDGEVYLFCRCKGWVPVLGIPQKKTLTEDQITKKIMDNIPANKRAAYEVKNGTPN